MASFLLERISLVIADLRLRLRVDTHHLALRVMDLVPLVVPSTTPVALPPALSRLTSRPLCVWGVRGRGLHQLTVISWHTPPWASGFCLFGVAGEDLPPLWIEIQVDRSTLKGGFYYPTAGVALFDQVSGLLNPAPFWQHPFVPAKSPWAWPAPTPGAPHFSFELPVAEFEVVSEGALAHLDRWLYTLGRVPEDSPPLPVDVDGWASTSPTARVLQERLGGQVVSHLVAGWRISHAG